MYLSMNQWNFEFYLKKKVINLPNDDDGTKSLKKKVPNEPRDARALSGRAAGGGKGLFQDDPGVQKLPAACRRDSRKEAAGSECFEPPVPRPVNTGTPSPIGPGPGSHCPESSLSAESD